jgi:hypothetical protein
MTLPSSRPDITTTSGSPEITGPAGSFEADDIGQRISHANLPLGVTTRIVRVMSDATAATMSRPATATGSAEATVSGWRGDENVTKVGTAGREGFGEDEGFIGWVPDPEPEAGELVPGSSVPKVQPHRLGPDGRPT